MEDDRFPVKNGKVPVLIPEYLVRMQEVATAMNPTYDLPERSFNAMLELVLVAGHERRVEAEWFLDLVRECMKARSLVAELRCEDHLSKNMEIDETQRKLMADAALLTNQELVVLRKSLQAKLILMASMKPTPTTLTQ